MQLFQELPLFVGEMGRNLDQDLHPQVPSAVAAEIRETASLESKLGARLGPGGNVKGDHPVEGRDLGLAPQGRVREAAGDFAAQIIPLPSEDRMLRNLDHHIEIARLPTFEPGLSLATDPEPHPRLDSWGDPHRHHPFLGAPPLALTCGTRGTDGASPPPGGSVFPPPGARVTPPALWLLSKGGGPPPRCPARPPPNPPKIPSRMS